MEHPKKEWPLVPVLAADLIDAFRRKATDILDVTLNVENSEDGGWVSVDTYSMLLILLFMLERVVKNIGVKHFLCSFTTTDLFVHFDISWKGKSVTLAQLREWESLELHIGKEGLPSLFQGGPRLS